MTVTVPQHYTAGQLYQVMQLAKVPDSSDLRFLPRVFGASKMTAGEFIAWFRSCLHQKITLKMPQTQVWITGRKNREPYLTDRYRDAQRLKGYGGCGRVIETPEIRKRLSVDHVHTYINGTYSLCADRDCEMRRG